jgi:hypothetical protein
MRFFVGQMCPKRLGKTLQVTRHRALLKRSTLAHGGAESVDQNSNLDVFCLKTLEHRFLKALLAQRGEQHGRLAKMVEMQQLRVLVRRLSQRLDMGSRLRFAHPVLTCDQGVEESQHAVQLAPEHIMDGEELTHK